MIPTPDAANPYQDLYIYYLAGRFRPGRQFKPDHYIGSWEEGDFSFLFFKTGLDSLDLLCHGLLHICLVDHSQSS